jgi:hypothetical protein
LLVTAFLEDSIPSVRQGKFYYPWHGVGGLSVRCGDSVIRVIVVVVDEAGHD